MRPKSIPFLLPGDHHIPVILVNYFLVSARHCIVMLHNAKCLHELLLLCQNLIFGSLTVHSDEKLRELSIITELGGSSLEVGLRSEVSGPVCIWHTFVIILPEVNFSDDGHSC